MPRRQSHNVLAKVVSGARNRVFDRVPGASGGGAAAPTTMGGAMRRKANGHDVERLSGVIVCGRIAQRWNVVA